MTKESKEKSPALVNQVSKSVVKLEADKMTLSELRELGSLITEFLEKSTIKEALEKTGVNSGQVNLVDMIIHLPKILLSSDEMIQEFAKVVQFATGVDITQKSAAEAIDCINDTLEVINKINLLPFLFKISSTFMNMIKG